MTTLKKHPLVLLFLVVFILVALTQEPARSAEAVGDAWGGLSDGTSSFVDGFFTFVDRLGDSS